MVFNQQSALKRVGGDAELLNDLLQTFLEDAPGQLAALTKAFEDGDLAHLGKLAHTLKGSSGTICAEDLHKTALDLEAAAREEKRDAAEKILAKISRELEQFSEACNSFNSTF